ncbi:MAG: D-2-hydroxyacid dehydrogenase [Gammaproteobacteria bacterium]|nr:D-2-hydroxyacid dehydrogenase [Gammaproteobacteria bacterium]
MPRPGKIKVHIKNNRHAADTFPNTARGEEVFTITRERYAAAAEAFPDVAARLEAFIDWDTDHFAESMAAAEALVCWNLPTAELARVAPRLKWIHIIGAGVEHLTPMDWLPAGVQLVNNKGVHADKAGEFGAMALLMLHNAMPAVIANQAAAVYDSLYSPSIAGKTVLVIGVGSIGAAVARQAKALRLHVIGVSRHGHAVDGVDEMLTPAGLEAALPRADFVFVATPLTAETRNLISRRRLDLLKPGAALVNIGRAPVVDYAALAEKLRGGELSGAILDVFEQEPLPADSPFWRVPNLLVTPHISADDGNQYVALTLRLFFENMRRYLNGEPLENQVRPDLGY